MTPPLSRGRPGHAVKKDTGERHSEEAPAASHYADRGDRAGSKFGSRYRSPCLPHTNERRGGGGKGPRRQNEKSSHIRHEWTSLAWCGLGPDP